MFSEERSDYVKKSTKILLGTGIAVTGAAVLAALYHYSTKYLLKLALDRKGPEGVEKNKDKLMSSNDISETMAKVMDAASVLNDMDLEQIELKGFDGVRLVGHWYCPENAKRVIVAMHGWRSTWAQDFGTIAPFWFENDCAVLFAEQRGQGNSGGEYMGFGLLERYDCRDWITWVNEKTESKLPIYLGGVSMGATTILMASGLDLPDNVKGIIADCGFTSPRAIWKRVVENNFRIPYGIYDAAARDISKKKIKEDVNYSTLEALKTCNVPVLFIHGTDDNFVPIEMTYENYKAFGGEKRLFIVPGAEHGMSYLVDKDGYESAVIDFWNKYDLEHTT